VVTADDSIELLFKVEGVEMTVVQTGEGGRGGKMPPIV
jgi:hypothetical protein